MTEPLPPPADLSYFILKSLESLSKGLTDLQASVTAMQVSLVSRTELKELRDHCDQEFRALQNRCDSEAKELGEKVSALRVQTAGVSIVTAAVIAWAVRKLGG